MDDQEALFPEIVSQEKEHFIPANRTGRKKGSRNLRHHYLEKIAKENAVGLVRSVIAAAMAGDMIAAKIIIDRLWPRPRTAPIAVDLPSVGTPAEIREAMAAALKQTFDGQISTDDGQAIMAMLKAKLDAHSIRTVEGTAEPVAQSSDARETLFLKLKTAIERRQSESGATIQ